MKNEPITKSQLANLLSLSLRTLQRKLKGAGLTIPRGLISPDSQILILYKLGYSDLATHLNQKATRANRKKALIFHSINILESPDNKISKHSIELVNS